jgi:hypothetical protein
MTTIGLAPKRAAAPSSGVPSAHQHTEIMWSCERGGSPHFPRDIDTILARKSALAPQPLEAFCRAVRNAEQRVWVLDGYFLVSDNKRKPDDRIETILDWLHTGLAASDIRILTADHAEVSEFLGLFKDQERYINDSQTRRDTRCLIQINAGLRNSPIDVHDRFAIVDDELWHFGATVGGFHASVNAASRGWNAAQSGAVGFFELIWNTCKGKR